MLVLHIIEKIMSQNFRLSESRVDLWITSRNLDSYRDRSYKSFLVVFSRSLFLNVPNHFGTMRNGVLLWVRKMKFLKKNFYNPMS